MGGFLDTKAPSIEAEYGRYIDGDLLGKIIAKNFFLNRIGVAPEDLYIPVGRYGDAERKYRSPDKVRKDAGDGHLRIGPDRLTFEIKCARINIANRHLGQAEENWAFTNVKTSPGKVPKAYDVLIAIGIRTLGLEDARYWQYLTELAAKYKLQGKELRIDARPDEEEFLRLCTFFIVSRKALTTNYFRLTLRAMNSNRYSKFAADGGDPARCLHMWSEAMKSCTAQGGAKVSGR